MIDTKEARQLNQTMQKIIHIDEANHFNRKIIQIELGQHHSNRKNLTLIQTDRPPTLRQSFDQEIPLPFVQICLMIQELSNMRIVQKLARPVGRDQKIRLLNEVNHILQQVQLQLNFIKRNSSQFSKSRGEKIKISFQKSSILIEEQIYPSKWKDGLRKTQVKICSFYKERLKMFQKVNSALGENFVIKKINIDEWLKECMKKMKGFCLCG